MSKIVMFISFKLVKGVSAADFLKAGERLNHEFMSKQKGYLSWQQLRDDETWVDLLTWETKEDAQNVDEASCGNAIAHEYYSFIEMESIKTAFYSVEKSY